MTLPSNIAALLVCGSERNADLSFSVLHFWSLESRKEEGWYCTRAAGANLHNNDKTQSPNHGGPISEAWQEEVLPLASDDNSFLFIIALGCWPNWLEIRFLFKIPAQLCQLLNDNNHVPPVQPHHTSCNHPCGVRLTTISSVCSRQFLPPQHTRLGSLLNTICKIQAIIEIAILHCSPANFVASSFHCLCSCWRWWVLLLLPKKAKRVSGTNLLWWHQLPGSSLGDQFFFPSS